jgi:hypothetical protein
MIKTDLSHTVLRSRCPGTYLSPVRNVGVGYAEDIRAIRINLDFHLGAIGRPIISHDSNARGLL